jgi:hypothetical protein
MTASDTRTRGEGGGATTTTTTSKRDSSKTVHTGASLLDLPLVSTVTTPRR